MPEIDPAATAWLLASTALVLLMTPGLAIFYGGMVRTTGVLNMIMMSFISIPLVTVAWLLVGYTLAFSEDAGGGLIGGLQHFGMLGITPSTVHGSVPELLFATFQLAFAILTAALVSGAIADRAILMAEAHHPALVLLDLIMDTMSGVEAIEQIKLEDPNARILVLTSFALALDAAVGRIEKRLMTWQPKAGETEKL